jgi:hypothetical protein
MTEIVRFPRRSMRPASTAGASALAVECTKPAISPELRAIALAWLRRERAALARRLQIGAMPDRIRARLEAEIARLDATIAEVEENQQ